MSLKKIRWFVFHRAQLSLAVFAAALLCLLSPAEATVTIFGGDHGPYPLGSGPHVIEIRISADAGERINSIDFPLRINDGIGPAPLVTGIDMNGDDIPSLGSPLPGGTTLFDDSVGPTSVFPWGSPLSPPSLEVFESALFEDIFEAPIENNSLLAKLRIDLTGVPVGVYPITFDDKGGAMPPIAIGNFVGVFVPNWVAGTITVVPEPSAFVLACLGVAGAIITRGRWSCSRD